MNGNLLIGKENTWEIDERIAEGGNGYIFKLKNNNNVLAKVFKYDSNSLDIIVQRRKARFFNEIGFLKEYSSQNIHMPQLIDECSGSSNPFFVVKRYHDIKWLYDQKLPYNEKLGLCIQLADAIEFIHSTGTAHRDIKPKNLLFEKHDGFINLILTDYGLISSDDLDSPGDRMGSYGYTPPELRFRDENTDDYFSSDVYEFAKTVYAFLSNTYHTFSEGLVIIGERDEIRTGGSSLFLEPIYEMIEKAIRYEMADRISIAECRNYLYKAKKLLTISFSSEWESKRNRRRILSTFVNTSNYSISRQDYISSFVSSVFKNEYDLELSEKKLIVRSIIEKPFPVSEITKGATFYELLYNQNEKMFFVIDHLVIQNDFADSYDLYIRNVNSDYTVSNVVMKYRVFKKNNKEVSSGFNMQPID